MSAVLVFGVFDGLHDGHKYFLTEAGKLGDNLHICVASDEYVQDFKNKIPKHNIEERKMAIGEFLPKAILHSGDKEIGKWNIFQSIMPDVIALGYDQKGLEEALVRSGFLKTNTRLVHMDEHKRLIA